ncbi:MAG: apolipoprotein N-acyltransferase [Acidobacteria bacterium]|nr:apolipoprotein N-acyltransferase [Acidobacteriota bacterium]
MTDRLNTAAGSRTGTTLIVAVSLASGLLTSTGFPPLKVVAVNAAFAWAAVARRRPVWRGLPVALAAGVVSVLHLAGVERLSVPGRGTVPAVLVQSEACSIRIAAEIHRRMPEGTRLAVWPEYATFEYADPGTPAFTELSRLAAASRCTLVAGCKESIPGEPEPAFFNAALVFGPDGRRLGAYHKANPVPFFRDGTPGTRFPAFPTEAGRIGIAICYDADFPSVSRTLVRNGAEILVVPTFDAGWWTARQHDQHAALAALRAVENGRWMLRATSSGVSQILDPCGRDHGRIHNFEAGLVFGLVEPRRDRTPYGRIGWMIGPGSLLLALGIVGTLVWPDVRRRFRNWRTQAGTGAPA